MSNVDPMKEYFYLSALEEAFKIKQVEYGLDLINQKWKVLREPDKEDIYITFFKHDEVFVYCCAFIFFQDYVKINFSLNLSSRKIMKMTGSEFNDYVDENINSVKDLKLHFNFDKMPVSNFLSVFNEVFYVMNEGIKKFKPREIRFSGYTEKLHKIYVRMTTDTNFLNELKKLGYRFKEITEDRFVCFKKLEGNWKDFI